MAANPAGRKRFAALSSRAVRASGERDRAAGIITHRAYTIPPISVTTADRCTPRMSSVRAAGERDRPAGIIPHRAYTIPPISVTTDDRCTHRMIAVRISPILVSILARSEEHTSELQSLRH